VAIVPPHPTVLSLRMAVAIYFTGISTPDLHLESPPLLGTLTGVHVEDVPSDPPIDVKWVGRACDRIRPES